MTNPRSLPDVAAELGWVSPRALREGAPWQSR